MVFSYWSVKSLIKSVLPLHVIVARYLILKVKIYFNV